LAWCWRGGRLEIGDAEGAEHGGGPLGAGCDGALGGAIAEVDVDDADGLENGCVARSPRVLLTAPGCLTMSAEIVSRA